MNRRTLRFALAGIFVPVLLWSAPPHQVIAFSFDWDDNVVTMPTQIYLYDRKTGKERGVCTADFAEIRHRVYGINHQEPEIKQSVWRGTDWSTYELRGPDATGSFREFSDAGGNRFLDAIVDMLKIRPAARWQGPSWEIFVLSLSRPDLALWSSIITARGQSEDKIQGGLRTLQRETGSIRLLPQTVHIYAVSSAKFQGQAASHAARKAQVMIDLLDTVNRQPLDPTMPLVLDPQGRHKKILHLWYFSDDDYVNFTTAIAVLSKEVGKNRWPNVKVTLRYTGTRRDGQVPHAVVIQPDGTTRALHNGEEKEARRIISESEPAAPVPILGRNAGKRSSAETRSYR